MTSYQKIVKAAAVLGVMYFTALSFNTMGGKSSTAGSRETTCWEEPLCPTLRRKEETKPAKKLPDMAISPRIWHRNKDMKWRGLQLPVLISDTWGELGNVMGEYATLYALGRIYGATVRLHPKMQKDLIKVFPNISIPLLPGPFVPSEWTSLVEHTPINHGVFEVAASGLMGEECFLLAGTAFEIQLFNAFRHDISKEFTFSKSVQKQVAEFWESNLSRLSGLMMMIGVHVRRTDYVRFVEEMFKAKMPGEVYLNRAVEYYREKFPEVRFLVASDDMAFVRKVFADHHDVLFAPGFSRELDLALLASCNHSIITLGSFGFWSGYLAGGEVLYPDVNATHLYQFQKSWYQLGQLDSFTPLEAY